MTCVKKISISLPSELYKELSRIVKESGGNKSAVIASILRHYLRKESSRKYSNKYPTALSKLSERGLIKLRSPKLSKTRTRSDWIIESEL